MTTERYVLLIVGALNVAAGALLAFPEGWPVEAKAGIVVLQAVAGYVLATVRSWDDAAPATPTTTPH